MAEPYEEWPYDEWNWSQLREEVSRLAKIEHEHEALVARLAEHRGRALAARLPTPDEAAVLAAAHAYRQARQEAFDRAQEGTMADYRQRAARVDECAEQLRQAVLALDPKPAPADAQEAGR
ncbi:MAG: hypothetical protein ACTHMU_03680 [Thermomicrobiales bacterium]